MKRALGALAVIAMVIVLFMWLGGWRWVMVQMAHWVAEPDPLPPPAGVVVERDIVFAETEDGPLSLDLYIPDPRPPGKLPVVVFVFGGGWFAGNKHQVQMVNGPLLARRGYAVVATTYRLSDVATFPSQIHDVKATIRWLRANADRYGLDASAIGAWGASAGGHLVALLATTGGVTELEGEIGGEALSGYSSDVQAVVDFAGPTHLAHPGDYPSDLEWMIEGLLGGKIAEREEIAELASPALHVSAKTAPILILHGGEDPIVPVEQSTAFHSLLQEAGADSTLHVVEGAGHGGEEFLSSEMAERIGSFFDRHLNRPR